MGVYVGHNRELCYEYNWLRRIDKIKKAIVFWNKRKVSIFGRVNIIKTYLLSKIVYPATVLPIPDEIVKEAKTVLFEYLWHGKQDRIKRSTVINDHTNGGLNMTDFDSFSMALKAAWVPKLIRCNGKWADLFYHILAKLNISSEYIWKTSFRSKKTFLAIKSFQLFYQEVILAFNAIKCLKQFKLMSKYQICEQPLWGNEYFKVNDECLYLKMWLESNMLYVKELVNIDGSLNKNQDT